MSGYKKYKHGKGSIFAKWRAKKLAKKKAEAERKRTIINSCIDYLEKKSNDILKDVYAMEDELRQKQEEVNRIVAGGGRQEEITRLQREFNRVNTKRSYQFKAYNGICQILSALYKLEALTEYLYARDWYKHFKYLPGLELAEKIKNESGSFNIVGAEINNLRKYILESVQDEFEDAQEFEELAKDIEREAEIRASMLDMPTETEINLVIPPYDVKEAGNDNLAGNGNQNGNSAGNYVKPVGNETHTNVENKA